MDTWMNILWGGWLYSVVPLIGGWVLDRIFADPAWLPHPVVGFGKIISSLEHKLNRGNHRMFKGEITSCGLILTVFILTWGVMYFVSPKPVVRICLGTIGVFYCLAGTTLVREVRGVFKACDESLEAGRRQVGRIVGRDTGELTMNEVRTAALETLAENLSDGVVAPLFWYMVAGLPGMMAYKMINTLDSMIGYRNERYREFGCVAARIDDAANFIPARLTAALMILLSGKWSLGSFVRRYGRCHASPNSGYPEAALAGILDCRFGGTHDYFGQAVVKPYIGSNLREIDASDLMPSVIICVCVEIWAVVLTAVVSVMTGSLF